MLILVWLGLVPIGLALFCGIARAGLQEDVLFVPRDPPEVRIPSPRAAEADRHTTC
jgi:hypothetical protein